MYTRYTCIYTTYTPNTPLNTPLNTPSILPILALTQPTNRYMRILGTAKQSQAWRSWARYTLWVKDVELETIRASYGMEDSKTMKLQSSVDALKVNLQMDQHTIDTLNREKKEALGKLHQLQHARAGVLCQKVRFKKI